jgi:hypothetical protein
VYPLALHLARGLNGTRKQASTLAAGQDERTGAPNGFVSEAANWLTEMDGDGNGIAMAWPPVRVASCAPRPRPRAVTRAACRPDVPTGLSFHDPPGRPGMHATRARVPPASAILDLAAEPAPEPESNGGQQLVK